MAGKPKPVCVLLPSWVRHHGGDKKRPKPIYSIDVHPSGSAIATGGGDFLVRMWSLQRITDHAQADAGKSRTAESLGDAERSGQQRLLARLDRHNGAVNCVRWSRNGRYLASGSDDRSVLVWEERGSGGPTAARWKCVACLSSTTEVLDVAWCDKSERVACGHIDNSVTIWDAKSASRLRVLHGHRGWVTGVAWDPRGEYIASRALSGGVIVWRVSDGTQAAALRAPFTSDDSSNGGDAKAKDAKVVGAADSDVKTEGARVGIGRPAQQLHRGRSRQVVFSRLGWSADGEFLASSLGPQCPRSRAHATIVFRRGSWTRAIDFRGHSRPSTVACYCPHLLRDRKTKDSRSAVAIGGMDGKVTVWVSGRIRATLSLQNFFSQTVLDLSWVPGGSGLFACSHDGTVAYFGVDLKEHLGLERVPLGTCTPSPFAPGTGKESESLVVASKPASRKRPRDSTTLASGQASSSSLTAPRSRRPVLQGTPVSVLLPTWVSHSGSGWKQGAPVYSVDVHPDGTRVATGGGDFAVKVWSVARVQRHLEQGASQQHPELLGEMRNHNGAVNCVKWSPNGRYLASASDDRSVMVWELASGGGGGAGALFGGDADAFDETWKCVAVLSGGTTEVLGVAWCPRSRRVASCHVDNLILIWDARTAARLRVLHGHRGWVTGLAWDPRDVYLASEASDGTVMLWLLSNGYRVQTIRKPFVTKEFGLGYHRVSNRQAAFTRLTWSPDGAFLAACRGYYEESKDFVSPVFERGTWRHAVDYTGHNRPTTVTRYCPLPLRDSATQEPRRVVAIGGMDGKVTVWVSGRIRATLSLQNFFSQTVLDLSWVPGGSGLFACSHDGTVAYFGVDLKEHFGVERITNASHEGYAARPALWSAPAAAVSPVRSRRGEGAGARRRRAVSGIVSFSAEPGSDAARRLAELEHVQTITRTRLGKRRIVPVAQGGGQGADSPARQFHNRAGAQQATRSLGLPIRSVVRGDWLLPPERSGPLRTGVKGLSSKSNAADVPNADEKCVVEASEGGGRGQSILRRLTDNGNADKVKPADVWTARLSAHVLAMAGSAAAVAFACDDYLLHLVRREDGKAIAPPMVLAAPIFALRVSACGGYLLYATCDGEVRVLCGLPTAGSKSGDGGLQAHARCSLLLFRTRHDTAPTALGVALDGSPTAEFEGGARYKYDRVSESWRLDLATKDSDSVYKVERASPNG